jgi:CubicO group peptidase (beta-lactamase class C family)
MTAALLATLVEENKLRWTTTLADVFTELVRVGKSGDEGMAPAYRAVTLEQLLTHRGGFPGETAPRGKSLLDVHRLPGTVESSAPPM